MNISLNDAERLQNIAEQMITSLAEFKIICKNAMTPKEWNTFTQQTLMHIVSHETLTDVAEQAMSDAQDAEDDRVKNAGCDKCGVNDRMEGSNWCNQCEKIFHDSK